MLKQKLHENRKPPQAAFFAILLTFPFVAAPAQAQETGSTEMKLGLDPAAPQAATLPGGMAPTFGTSPENPRDWRFDFHGLLTMPLRAGINTRDDRRAGQSKLVLHTPPVVPDDLETFSHTGVVPTPYAQLNFSYGNNIVTGTVSIVAKVASVSAGFLDPSAQLGVNDVFVTFNLPDLSKKLKLRVNVGAFSNRYGASGEYDEGRYGTPLIARINGVGENVEAVIGLGDVALLFEQGIQGLSSRPSGGILPDASNGFADQRVGASFVGHVHAGASYKGLFTIGGHYLHAWSQDQYSAPTQPDGSIGVLGADLRLSLGRFGHLYLAYAHTDAEHSVSVGRIVEVLNTPGGPGLEQNYFGTLSGGTGKLSTFGGQYDLSVGRLVSYPTPFAGDGPDIIVGLHGLSTQVESEDPRYDGIGKMKYGVEATYSLLPWLAVSGRYDRVAPDVDNDRYSFAVLSPRVIFRTGWQAHDQVVLQYSHWFTGAYTTVRTGYPPRDDITAIPDEHSISLSGSMWW